MWLQTRMNSNRRKLNRKTKTKLNEIDQSVIVFVTVAAIIPIIFSTITLTTRFGVVHILFTVFILQMASTVVGNGTDREISFAVSFPRLFLLFYSAIFHFMAMSQNLEEATWIELRQGLHVQNFLSGDLKKQHYLTSKKDWVWHWLEFCTMYCLTYSSNHQQRLTHGSWCMKLETDPLNRSYKRLNTRH